MASYHKPDLTSELLHFNVKCHMATHKLVAHGCICLIWYILNVTLTFCPSFSIAAAQKALPFQAFRMRACFLMFTTILLLFLSICLSHQLKEGSLSILCTMVFLLSVLDGILLNQTTSLMRQNYASTDANFPICSGFMGYWSTPYTGLPVFT